MKIADKVAVITGGRQWPEGAGEDQLNVLDVRRKLVQGLPAETR